MSSLLSLSKIFIQHPVKLTADVLLQLKRNDPDLKNVVVYFHFQDHFNLTFFDAFSVDWAEGGPCISNNTHLETLCIHDALRSEGPSDRDDVSNMVSFIKAIARNTSITELSLWNGGPDLLPLVFEGLASRFGNVNGLRKLELTNIHYFHISDIHMFISALQGYGPLGSTLEHIEIGCCQITGNRYISVDAVASQLIEAVGKYCKLVKLGWGGNPGEGGLGNNCIQSLAQLLNNPNCMMEDIKFEYCCNGRVDTTDSVVLANALSNYNKIKRIDLSHNTWFGDNEWTKMFQWLQSPSCSLEDLRLHEPVNVPNTLLDTLSSNSSLKVIDLGATEGISTEQWLSFADSLQGANIEILRLRGNQYNDNDSDADDGTNINGEVVASFAQLLINNTSLCELDFGGNHFVDDEVVLSFANVLAMNCKLTVLGFDPICIDDDMYRDKISSVGWNAIKFALCDTSSIDATFKSNHILETIGVERDSFILDEIGVEQWEKDIKLPKDLSDLLQLNASGLSKFCVARKKILLTHFCDENSNNMSIFDESMDWQVIPHTIAWMLRHDSDTFGQTLFYWMLRSFPFVLSGPEKKNVKRKRV